MYKEPEKETVEETEEKKLGLLDDIEHFNWTKFLKVSVGGLCLVWNVILTMAFLLMFNPVFLLFAGSMYICGRYLRLVLIEEWLVY